MSFEQMKKNRQATLSSMLAQAQKASGGPEKKSYEDDRFWQPQVDKAGNGYAVIRFLPAAQGEELPWIRYWDHGFKGPTGRWYIENSLTTIGQKDPVSDLNSKLWNTGREEDKEMVRARKRRLHYVANILIISDPANPANDGQVRLFKFGKKIFDKILDVMQPAFQDEKPVNPFDFWEGADFKLKIRNVEGYRNYDKSEFGNQAPLFDDDSKMEAIWKKEYSLQEFLAPSNFKSYDELKSKLHRVLGLDSNPNSKPQTKVPSQNELDESYAMANAGKTAEAKAAPKSDAPWDEEDDDTMAFFKKLAS